MSWRVGGRPVRVELTRTEEFFTITRHAATVHLRTGVRRDGTIVAREARILWSAGAYADISPRLIKNGGYSSAGPYRIPHVAVDSYAVYTNVTPAGGFRGYAIPQVAWAYESQMDLIADRLGIDPVELRLHNLLRDGDEFATGQTVEDFHLGELVQTVSERIGWSGPGPTEASAPGLVRGKGIACTLKTTVTPSTSTAAIKLNEDGSRKPPHEHGRDRPGRANGARADRSRRAAESRSTVSSSPIPTPTRRRGTRRRARAARR